MKKIVLIIFLGFTALLNASIGKIVSMQGDISIERAEKIFIPSVGFKLEKNDTVKTEKNAKAKLVFSDNTIITVGKSSVMNISEFLYGSKENSKAEFGFLEGTFKTITGKVGKIAPKSFKLKTRNATIGIRGTEIVVKTGKDGDTIACTGGAIDVRTPDGKVVSFERG